MAPRAQKTEKKEALKDVKLKLKC